MTFLALFIGICPRRFGYAWLCHFFLYASDNCLAGRYSSFLVFFLPAHSPVLQSHPKQSRGNSIFIIFRLFHNSCCFRFFLNTTSAMSHPLMLA